MSDKKTKKPRPHEEEEVTVTEKTKLGRVSSASQSLHGEAEQDEVSGISQKLEQIESQIYEENTQNDFVTWMNQTSEGLLGKLKSIRLKKPGLNLKGTKIKLPAFPKSKFKKIKIDKRIWYALGVVLLLFVVLRVAVPLFKSSNQPKAERDLPGVDQPSKSFQAKPLKITVLKVKTADGKFLQNRRFNPRQSFFVETEIVDWNHRPGEATEIATDIRIYGPRGKLMYYQPEKLRFKGVVDPAKNKLLVQPRITLARTVEPGPYRVMLTIKEKSTNRQVVRQTMFSVVPR